MKTITLPNKEEMKRRLCDRGFTSHESERFFPLLLAHAGTEKLPSGVALMLISAMKDYVKDLPPEVELAGG